MGEYLTQAVNAGDPLWSNWDLSAAGLAGSVGAATPEVFGALGQGLNSVLPRWMGSYRPSPRDGQRILSHVTTPLKDLPAGVFNNTGTAATDILERLPTHLQGVFNNTGTAAIDLTQKLLPYINDLGRMKGFEGWQDVGIDLKNYIDDYSGGQRTQTHNLSGIFNDPTSSSPGFSPTKQDRMGQVIRDIRSSPAFERLLSNDINKQLPPPIGKAISRRMTKGWFPNLLSRGLPGILAGGGTLWASKTDTDPAVYTEARMLQNQIKDIFSGSLPSREIPGVISNEYAFDDYRTSIGGTR